MQPERVREGAYKVLTQCLGLSQHEVLSVFHDETALDVTALLTEVAGENRIKVCTRFVTLKEQAEFADHGVLSDADRHSLDQARGILTCLSQSAEGNVYRRSLIKYGTNDGKVFGHMPGVTMEIVAHAMNVNYDRAQMRCDDLAVAMRAGKRATLRTYVFDEGGHPESEYDLELDLGGFQRSPVSSTGIIPPGTWGNLPGGETFIAPVERCAEGAFVLNGAFTGRVLGPSEHILLRFEHGEWTQIDCDDLSLRNELVALLNPERGFGKHRRVLAELGIGVNPGIQVLTGTALFDEKCEGTAHVATGDNTGFGGDNESDIHEDLVTTRPSLWIDGMPILYYGENVFEANQWR